ncbi:MAG: S9 family peptidase [Acidobacteriia bacterium]|nr:S9 family peptidase [Terriglobia bacterium]
MSLYRLALPLLVAHALLAGDKKPVTLESISAGGRPVTFNPIWSPDSKSFLRRQGTRLLLYDIASRKEKELVDTRLMEEAAVATPQPEAFEWTNRRAREQPVQWSSSGGQLLLQIKGDLFLFDMAASNWKQLTRTAEAEMDPKLSPDARRVSFRLEHDLWVLEIASGKRTRLTSDGSPTRLNGELDWVYPEELDLGTAHWWSPDSRRIAYLQFDTSPIMIYPHADLLKIRPVAEPQRYPQAGTPNSNVRAGVLPASGGKTKWLELGEPSDGLLARLEWMPDSSAVALQRLTRIQNRLWLQTFDASSGKAQKLEAQRASKQAASCACILEESDSAWINVRDDSRFLAAKQELLWGSERDGYRHLYLYPLLGGEPKRLTTGEWEVTDLACVDQRQRAAYYMSTEASPLERHLYRVGLDGSGKRKITSLPGTHTIHMSPDCASYTDTHSSLVDPPRTSLHLSDGSEVAVLSERNRKLQQQFEILPTELIRFRGGDGAEFHARLIKPAGFQQDMKYPAVVMVYGGPQAQTVRESWRGADWDQALAHRGFVIWQMDGRGSAGRGHVWEKPLHRRFGQRELADQVEGVKHLISLGFVDAARVGLHGWSYGGFMTLYGLFHAPETFHAGISGAPVTDWRHYDTIYTERYLGLPSENEEGYKAGSPVHYASQLKGKLLLVHNFEDDNVLFQHTLRMMDALQRAGKQFEFQIYPQKSHAVSGPAHRHMIEMMTNFLERSLK